MSFAEFEPFNASFTSPEETCLFVGRKVKVQFISVAKITLSAARISMFQHFKGKWLI